MHMALVANILNAVGVEPSLYSKEFISNYPSRQLPNPMLIEFCFCVKKRIGCSCYLQVYSGWSCLRNGFIWSCSPLCGGVQPDLIFLIEKLSLGLIRNIFMKIEQTEREKQRISRFQQIFSFAHHHKRLMEGKGHCQRGEESAGCKKHESTVRKNMLITDPHADGDRSLNCSFFKERFLKD